MSKLFRVKVLVEDYIEIEANNEEEAISEAISEIPNYKIPRECYTAEEIMEDKQ